MVLDAFTMVKSFNILDTNRGFFTLGNIDFCQSCLLGGKNNGKNLYVHNKWRNIGAIKII